MKAILLSIRPEWCNFIIRGQKTLEVRRTRPKLETPFKVYVYCTKAPQHLITIFKDCEEIEGGEIHHGKPVFVKCDKYLPDSIRDKTQMIIGEFTCDDIDRITPLTSSIPGNLEERILGSRLTPQQVEAYAGWKGRRLIDCRDAYCWHISNFKLYKEPVRLKDFWGIQPCNGKCRTCRRMDVKTGECKGENLGIDRPPQSWYYVEVAD